MKANGKQEDDIYYTPAHTWIGFKGLVAYVGICSSKLAGFKKIQSIRFAETFGLKQKGENIATLIYKHNETEICMPVDGRILELNPTLVKGKYEDVINSPEHSGWIALINPLRPYDREGLLLPGEYRMKNKVIHSNHS